MKKVIYVFVLALTVLISQNRIIAQSSINGVVAGHAPPANAGLYWCGWNAATLIDFNLEHRGALNINFLTGGVQRMTILGSAAGPSSGYVGIGNNFTTPLYRLDVHDNINITILNPFAGNGYRIDGFTVLQNPGLENIFVGRGAAANYAGGNWGRIHLWDLTPVGRS